MFIFIYLLIPILIYIYLQLYIHMYMIGLFSHISIYIYIYICVRLCTMVHVWLRITSTHTFNDSRKLGISRARQILWISCMILGQTCEKPWIWRNLWIIQRVLKGVVISLWQLGMWIWATDTGTDCIWMINISGIFWSSCPPFTHINTHTHTLEQNLIIIVISWELNPSMQNQACTVHLRA